MNRTFYATKHLTWLCQKDFTCHSQRNVLWQAPWTHIYIVEKRILRLIANVMEENRSPPANKRNFEPTYTLIRTLVTSSQIINTLYVVLNMLSANERWQKRVQKNAKCHLYNITQDVSSNKLTIGPHCQIIILLYVMCW